MPIDNGRIRVSVSDIMNSKAEDLPESKRAALPRDFFSYRPKLYRSLAMPSYVHGYSLAIEFMRNWFLRQFPKDYFKWIHINGKHVLDDWKHFNNYNIKHEKPMLAIIPTVEYEYDRDQIDTYMADKDLYLKKSNYQQSFFKDYDTLQFLYMQMRALKMNFTFRVRVGSRSAQLDLFNRMEIWFRIGATQHQRTSVDFNIPYEIMASIAKGAGFDLDKNGKIKDEDIIDFMNYVNKRSDLPITYKMRAINQHPEFFVRVKDLYTHISTKDKLILDDGEREGTLENNFNIEMNCSLTIPIPHFYVYFDQIPLVDTIPVKERDDAVAVYSINNFEVPPYNELTWGQVAITEYYCEKGETFIDLSSILAGSGNVCKVLRDTVKNGISPKSFMDIKIFHSDDREKLVLTHMDYQTNIVHFDEPMDANENLIIAIYADKEYINGALVTLNNIGDNRITEPTNSLAN
jgi:hypothetical protein